MKKNRSLTTLRSVLADLIRPHRTIAWLALAALLLQLRHLQARFTLLVREVALMRARDEQGPR